MKLIHGQGWAVVNISFSVGELSATSPRQSLIVPQVQHVTRNSRKVSHGTALKVSPRLSSASKSAENDTIYRYSTTSGESVVQYLLAFGENLQISVTDCLF
jgi:hypothetical protein